MVNESDVFIAGAGPAGLAVAILAASAGMSVSVADANTPPLDKACGEGLMPLAHEAFPSLGIELTETNSHPFSGIRFIGKKCQAEARFIDGVGHGVRRTCLSEMMLSRAEKLRVKLNWQTTIRRLCGHYIETSQGVFRARWIVGADGLNSSVRRAAGLDSRSIRSRRIGIRQHFHIRPWSDAVEVYWGRRTQAYVTPTASNEICVAIMSRDRLFDFATELREFSRLSELLKNASASDCVKGSASLDCKVRTVANKNIALVGDASGSVDALTGDGVSLAFRQAGALTRALTVNNLDIYRAEHARICEVPRFMSTLLRFMDLHPRAQEHVLRAFSRSPELFASMLRIHTSDDSLKFWGRQGFVDLGTQLMISALPQDLSSAFRGTAPD